MESSSDTIQLQDRGRTSVEQENAESSSASRELQSLPPVEGRQAWSFLFGSFIVEMICLGGAFSWSIFQNYLMTSPESPLKDSSNVTISAVGTLLLSMLYFSPALVRPLLHRYPDWARKVSVLALVTAVCSLVIASFVELPAALLVLVGLIHGAGVGVTTTPYMIWLPQWFDKRRGLANGIAFAGAGTGGLIFPFVFTTTLNKLGFAWTMRIWAIILLAGAGFGLVFVKPRLPTVRAVESGREHKLGIVATLRKEFVYVTSPIWILNASLTFLASAGLFAVSFYLATYCNSLGLSPSATSGAVSAFNAAGLLGEISIGYACDRMPYPLVVGVIGICGSVSTFLLLGLAHNLPTVVCFTLLFGWAAGSYCATWSAACVDISKLRKVPVDSVMMSLVFVRGIAALVGPLIAAALYQPQNRMSETVFGSFGFGPLIEFVGTCMMGILVLAGVTGLTRKQLNKKGAGLSGRLPVEGF
ncbi:MFS general substrate transporter [Meredithblackwellia eburnea MCA 4105]